jgi:hypothetical protein
MAAPFGNQYALGNTGGRPPKFETPQDLEKRIKEYFEHIDKQNEEAIQAGNPLDYEPPTITGLLLFCGFSHLQQFFDQEKRSEEFSDVIKRAKAVVMKIHERRLGSTTPTGSIFWLKNFGWKDTQQIDHTNAGSAFNNLTDAELISRIDKLIASREEG